MRKMISLLLALALAVPLLSLGAVSASAAETNAPAWTQRNDGKIYFYADPALFRDVYSVYIYLYERDEGELIVWGSKKGKMTDEGNHIWSFDPEAAGIRFAETGRYGVIFTADWDEQTADMIIGSACLGDLAYPVEKTEENVIDSNLGTFRAAWVNADPTKYGMPVMITSLGNVVGDVYWSDESAYTLFVRFLIPSSSYTGIANAVKYNGKTVRQTAEDTAIRLGLSAEEFNRAVQEAGVDLDNYDFPSDDSTCIYFETQPYFMDAHQTVSAYIFAKDEEGADQWGSRHFNMEPVDETVWMYDLSAHGFSLDDGKEYSVIFTADWQVSTNALPLNGHLWDCASLTGNTLSGSGSGGSTVYEAVWDNSSEAFYPWFFFKADEAVIGEEVTSVYAYIFEDGGKGIFDGESAEQYRMTYEGEDYWLFDLSLRSLSLSADKSYSVIFYINGFNSTLGTAALPLSVLCAGDMARLTGDVIPGSDESTVSFDAAWDSDRPSPVPEWQRRHDRKIYFFADPDVLPANGGVTAEIYQIDMTRFEETLLRSVAMTEEETDIWSYDVKADGFTFEDGAVYSVRFKTGSGETLSTEFAPYMLGDMAYPVEVFEDEIWAVWYNDGFDVVYGDINGDGEMTVQDVTLLQRYLAEFKDSNGEPILDSYTMFIADFNGDGAVNITDATDMQRVLAEMDF